MWLSFHTVWLLASLITVGTNNAVALEQERVQSPLITASDGFDAAFDAFVEQTLQKLHVPGLSIAIVDHGKISSKGYGFATLPDRKATADTRYFTASTTKAFTAAAMGMLVHDTSENYSSVQWISPINDFIRGDFVLENEYATNHITIEDALSHRTGLPGHDIFYGRDGDTPSKVVQRLRWLPMNAQPRTEWQYCNVMYAVITDLLQTVTGKALETLLWERIWRPLGMRSTSFTVPGNGASASQVATGYYWVSNETDSEAKGQYIPERLMDLACTSGDGATLSTVNDYALGIRALLNAAEPGLPWNQSSPISRSLFRDMVSPRAIIPIESGPEEPLRMPPLYALGWITAAVIDQQVLTHSGGIYGSSTEVWMLPGLQYGVVTMSNTANTADVEIVTRLLVEKLYPSGERMSMTRKDLIAVQRASLHTRKHRRKRMSLNDKPLVQPRHPPLPLPLADFAGTYSHPAYGNMTFTVTLSSHSPVPAMEVPDVLVGIFHPRANVEKHVLTHISGTLFQLQSFQAHGIGDVTTGEGIVREDVGEQGPQTFAVFEVSPSGRNVESLGLDLDPDMIRMARTRDSLHWKDRMVWFRRVG